MKQINNCEVCDNKEIEVVLNLGKHALCDDLIEIKSNKKNQKYPIEILFCNICKTAHQKFQIDKKTLFPGNYHYRAKFTKDVLSGMENLVEECLNLKNKLNNNHTVLDIGCNDGSLLNFFKIKNFKTIGVEPTKAALEARSKCHLVYNDYFSEEVANEILKNHGCPDIITFTNVFAHIDDLNDLIRNLKKLIDREKTMIVIENHYLGSIIKNFQFDTFYHEHPRTYSLESFKYIAKKLGLKIFETQFPSRYGGNIRIFMNNKDDISKSSFPNIIDENSFFYDLKKMQNQIEEWKIKTKNKILDLNSEFGKIPCKAFPGRAAIILELLNLDDNIIECIYEQDLSPKINHYAPGTRIPIISDKDLIQKIHKIPVLINLAWHIKVEIKKYLQDLGFKGKLVEVL